MFIRKLMQDKWSEFDKGKYYEGKFMLEVVSNFDIF